MRGKPGRRGGGRGPGDPAATATPPVPQARVCIKRKLCRIQLLERVVGETHGRPPAFLRAVTGRTTFMNRNRASYSRSGSCITILHVPACNARADARASAPEARCGVLRKGGERAEPS